MSADNTPRVRSIFFQADAFHLAAQRLTQSGPDKTKQVIENEWNAETAKRSTVLDEIDRRAGGAVTARTLTDALSKEGDAFVDWRYAHEPGPLCNFSLSNLPAILRNQIMRRRLKATLKNPDLLGKWRTPDD